jgi:hypothetical protein
MQEVFMAGAGEGAGQARGPLAAGDVPGLVRYLRAYGGTLPLGEIAALAAGIGRGTGCADLARAAPAVAEGADGSCASAEQVKALYGFGCECADHEIGFLAVRPLARALELAPDDKQVPGELVEACSKTGSTPAPWRCWRSTRP